MSSSLAGSCCGSARAWERRSERSREIHADCSRPGKPAPGRLPIRPPFDEDKPLGRPEWKPKPAPLPVGPPIDFKPKPELLPLGPPIKLDPPTEADEPAPRLVPLEFGPKKPHCCYGRGRGISVKVPLETDPIQPAVDVLV